MSSLGKGIAAATLGALLRARSFKVRLRKFDPYLNVDTGTMNPYQHGEVFVTEDGTETDLDLGHYERFTGVNAKKEDSITTGKLYLNVLERERRGDYLGQTIQIVPHITNEIKSKILEGRDEVDFLICEIGGTVGDMEGLAFLEAIRQLRHELGAKQTLFMHLGWVPTFDVIGEVKTKPMQHSVKELQRSGIQPDLLVCRCDQPMSLEIRKKISLFCNVDQTKVIEACNVDSIYETPLTYHEAGLDTAVCDYFNLAAPAPDLSSWQHLNKGMKHPKGTVCIGIIGKYRLPDAYRSVLDSLSHGGLPSQTKVEYVLMDGRDLEEQDDDAIRSTLSSFHGILVPGGFGKGGSEGKIKAIGFARENNVPFLGICFGLQLAVIEGLRHLGNLPLASSSEFGDTPDPAIALLMEWGSEDMKHTFQEAMGGTMRLGAYECTLKTGSFVAEIYGEKNISERHRHRYEVNNQYIPQLEAAGFTISGTHKGLVECIERRAHPWFVGTQFHPEFSSRPLSPHPLFASFIAAAARYRDGACS